MHESSLVADLLAKVDALALENGASKVAAIEISIGALAGIGMDHFREHFRAATLGTPYEHVDLRLRLSEDPVSSGLLLESVELER
jgi:Zn finger protein HypA/HybF involved in hydrogenase expression